MRAHEYPTLHSLFASPGESPAEWFKRFVGPLPRHLQAQVAAECDWLNDGRPYYTVYPVAQGALARVRLDIPAECVRLPLQTLLIRFGVGHEPETHGRRLRSILAGSLIVRGDQPGIGIWCDFGERDMSYGGDFPFPIMSFVCLSVAAGATIEERLKDLDVVESGDAEDHAAIHDALRCVVGVSLLGEDSELVEPDVLAKDRRKWDETRDPAIVDRAVRRGKRGWLIGSHIDVAPHIRRPHFGLRWTGEGRTVPRIVPVAGCVVRRKKIVELPTGYLDAKGES